MARKKIKIGVTAPSSRIDPSVADRINAIADRLYPDQSSDIYFHPQCFLSSGHFAGDDETRSEAFLEIANDERFDALWFARGGYGSCRLAEGLLPKLTKGARNKLYLGYSDAGFLLAGLYRGGFEGVAHGPMPSDVNRKGGETAIKRALAYLVDRAPDTLEASVSPNTKTTAFNIITFSHLLGTPFQPDLTGHVLMLEDVDEHMYQIDRALFHITSNPGIRKVAGIRLGRCSEIQPNDPDFEKSEIDVIEYWCRKSGIPYLGRADIGHDVDNKVVPFGRLQAS